MDKHLREKQNHFVVYFWRVPENCCRVHFSVISVQYSNSNKFHSHGKKSTYDL